MVSSEWGMESLPSIRHSPLPIRYSQLFEYENNQAERAISTGKLNALPRLHIRPINVVVFHGSILRDLVLTWVSRLDAFSGYPVRT